MKNSKFAASLLTLGLTAGLVTPVMAIETEAKYPAVDDDPDLNVTASGIEVDKTAKLEDDGTYTFDLEAYVTGTVSTTTKTDEKGVPCDIVLVLDQSGSMNDEEVISTTYSKADTNRLTYNSAGWKDYYVLYNGQYYKVSTGTQGILYKKYYLYITVDNTAIYLNGTNFSTEMILFDLQNSTIWNGDVYTMKSVSEKKIDTLKRAVNSFITKVLEDATKNAADHKIAVVGFASDETHTAYSSFENTEILSTENVRGYTSLTTSDYKNALVDVNRDGVINSRLTTAVNSLDAEGGTFANYGLEMANSILENRDITTFENLQGEQQNRKKIVVFFTDGVPGAQTDSKGFIDNNYYLNISTANNTLSEANKLKESGATIYSVGVIDGLDPEANHEFIVNNANRHNDKYYSTLKQATNAYMHFVSSNYDIVQNMEAGNQVSVQPKKGYFVAANNEHGLDEIFEKISESVSSSTVETQTMLKDTAELKDVLPKGFKLTENSEVTATLAPYKGKNAAGIRQWGEETTDASLTVEKNLTDQTVTVTGFDYSDNAVVDEKDSIKTGGKKINVKITGVVPTDEAVTGELIKTNANTSGIYAPNEETGTIELKAVFPRPTTILTKQAYVLDYAKAEKADLKETKLDSITKISQELSGFVNPKNEYGTLTMISDGVNKVSYQPNTMDWNGFDTYYLFGKTEDTEILTNASANANGNLWSRVSFVPANNVYYEDDFVTDSTKGTIGIVYSDDWKVDRVDKEDVANQLGSDENHGWIDELKLNNGFTDGSAHYATVTKGEALATASFQFTGTGFDIYSKTNNLTGKVTAFVYKTSDVKEEERQAKDNTIPADQKYRAGAIAAKTVNTYAKSGDYYHIPAVHFDMNEYVKPGEDAHQSYTVKLSVMSSGSDDRTENGDRKSTYYIDGIRIYNPIKNLEGNQIIKDAYGNEINATFINLRKELLENGNQGTEDPDGKVYYIDGLDGNDSLAVYEKDGPANEIYLSAGQKVGFKVTDTEASYQVGLKTPKGVATVKLSNGDKNTSSLDINSATDMYYTIVPDSNGYIFIENTSSKSILSVTKLKRTKSETATVTEAAGEEAILEQARVFTARPMVEYNATVENTPEDTEPVNPDLEPGDEGEETGDPSLGDILKSLLDGFIKLFPPFN